MATHSSTLAWKIPLVGEPGGLQSMSKLLFWSFARCFSSEDFPCAFNKKCYLNQGKCYLKLKCILQNKQFLLAMKEINFQEKVGIYSWFKKKNTNLSMIVLDKICEFGEFYALV